MQTKKMFLGWAVFSLILQSSVVAETIQGTISSIDFKKQSVSIERKNDTTGQTENFDVMLTPETHYQGIALPKELNVGNKVKIEVLTKNRFGKWKVKSLEVSEEQRKTGEGVQTIDTSNLSEEKYIPQVKLNF